jgi:ElaB/YqjD/DUF883 family membrane-anchored ribosome-binding protein
MAKPLHRSSDVASFDTYPADPAGSGLAQDPDRLLPEGAESSSLEQYGSQLGSAAGQAVLAFRRAQERVKDLAREKKTSVTDIASARVDQVRDQTAKLRQETARRGEEWQRMLRERAGEWRRQVRNGIYRARLRAREIQNDRPLQVVAGAAVVGVVIGAVLRIWRASRA